MWAFWTQRLKRPSDEFWALTTREVIACIDQYLDERDETRMLFGTIAAMHLTVAAKGKQSFSWKDIFRAREASQQQTSKISSIEETRERWQKVFEAVGTNR